MSKFGRALDYNFRIGEYGLLKSISPKGDFVKVLEINKGEFFTDYVLQVYNLEGYPIRIVKFDDTSFATLIILTPKQIQDTLNTFSHTTKVLYH